MIPQQNVVAFPEFSNTGTKIAPDAAKYAAGFQQSDVLPAEWLNYFLNKASAGQTVNNAINDSVQKELQNVVTQAGLTPSEADNTQVFTAVKNFITGNTKTMLCNTDADVSPEVTNYGFISALYDNLSIKVLFKNGAYGEDEETSLTFNVNNLGAKKIFVPKNGELEEIKSVNINRGDGAKYWFLQPFTTLNMTYDTTLDDGVGGWIVTENAVVLSGSDYTIYADGRTEYTKHAIDANQQKNYSTLVDPNTSMTISFENNDCGMIFIMIGNAVYNVIITEVVGNVVYSQLIASNGQVPEISTNGRNMTLTFGHWGYSVVRVLKM